MTPQVKILTGMKARATSSEYGVMMNKFYGASEDYIRANFNEAEIVYADVFKGFISAWFQIGDRKNPPPLEWQTLVV